MITQCLVLGCQSPPDLAYAMEYATSICGRAGVKVKLELPEEYLDTVDGAYFRCACISSYSSATATANAMKDRELIWK